MAFTLWLQVAAALKAEKLILMTDVPGVMRDKDDVSTKFTELDIKDTRQLVAEGVIAGGMIPKVMAGAASLDAHVCNPEMAGAVSTSWLFGWQHRQCWGMMTVLVHVCAGGVLYTVLGARSSRRAHH